MATILTVDNFVDGTDFATADNNAANFVSAITPKLYCHECTNSNLRKSNYLDLELR